jgi:predicted transcriptional regulator
MKINDEDIDLLVHTVTLKMFHIGADEINYKILKMVPTDVNSIMINVELTKVPVNARLNSLEEVGLIKRKKGTGKIVPTDFTMDFLGLLDQIKIRVNKSLRSQLSALC